MAHAPPSRPASARVSRGAASTQSSQDVNEGDSSLPNEGEADASGKEEENGADAGDDAAVVVEGLEPERALASVTAHQFAFPPPIRSTSLDSFNVLPPPTTTTTTTTSPSLGNHPSDTNAITHASSFSSRSSKRNPNTPIPHPIITGSTAGAAGLFKASPMSSPRTHGHGDPSLSLSHRVSGPGSGLGQGTADREHERATGGSFTSALSPTLSLFDDPHAHGHAAAFHRRRMSNPTRRRSSLGQEPLSGSASVSRSNSISRQGSTDHSHLPTQPHTTPAGPSSALGWLGNRLTLPPQEQKRSKSDDEREHDDVDSAKHLHDHPRASHSSSSSPALGNRRSRRTHSRAMRVSLDAQFAGGELPDHNAYPSRLGGVSVPPVLSPIPVTASLSSPSELLSLPQDPDHILPLSTPPSVHRESLESADPRAAPASGGHASSTPRTSISLSEEMGWGGGGTRSYSDSSAGDDDESSPTKASGWWWRAHPRPPSMRPMMRQSPSRLLNMGTRRWGWLLAPVRHFTASHDYQSLLGKGRKNSGYDREKIYPTTTKRKQHTASKYLALAAEFVQTEPWAIVLGFVAFAMFGICLGFSIKYILDPDKAALPWREYATKDYPTIYSIQNAEWDNSALGGRLPPLSVLEPVSHRHQLWPYQGHEYAPHKENLHGGARVDDVEPTTVFLAIFTYDIGTNRRNLIRESYASHPRSRSPGSEGVRLRFMMGRPRPQFKADVDAEQEAHGDIVILDMEENMNSGKTHTFFSWAASHAMVPDYEYPSHPRSPESKAEFAAQRAAGETPKPIYRGEKKADYIAKADDDAFIMLGELERHLRVTPRTKTFWGYLVRERFMAGECYALSRDLVEYIRDTESLRAHINGKEDKLVSKWLRTHPSKEEILWFSERAWIYDHPKGGTVYSHGYLFPDEVERARSERIHGLSAEEQVTRHEYLRSVDAYSTVSRFGTKYRPPLRNLSPDEAAEALVEGSPMSRLRKEATERHAHTREDMPDRVDQLMAAKPSFKDRFLGDEAERGGTVVVHFIKKKEWFEETIRALLGSESRE